MKLLEWFFIGIMLLWFGFLAYEIATFKTTYKSSQQFKSSPAGTQLITEVKYGNDVVWFRSDNMDTLDVNLVHLRKAQADSFATAIKH